MVTKQTEPDVDAWKDQERRQHSPNRTNRFGAIVVAVLVIVAVALGIGMMGGDDAQPTGSARTHARSRGGGATGLIHRRRQVRNGNDVDGPFERLGVRRLARWVDGRVHRPR